MLHKTYIAAILSTLFLFSACEEFELPEVPYEPTDEEIAAGLKEALHHGNDTAVSNLSAPDGYFGDALIKILLPAEAQPVYNAISNIPFLSSYIDETILAINRAAEDAAVEAKPIFFEAITDMTISDAVGILMGEDSAATHYLKEKTYDKLFAAFQPKVENSLSKDLILGISAEESYSRLINTYNDGSGGGILWKEIESNSLSNHTTDRALRGLFVKVAEEEKNIRTNPLHRVTEILQEIFALQDEE